MLPKPTGRSAMLALLAALAFGKAPLHAEEEELPVLIRSFQSVDTPAPPFQNGVFRPAPSETIAFIGGTNTFEQDRFGYLEMKFHLAWPNHSLKLRNLAWQGDVLDHQARPRNFYTVKGDPQPGSIPDNRERTEPGIIFVCFGKQESLEGPEAFDGYEPLIVQLKALTQRIVLVAPTPFFETGPAAPLAESRNETLGGIVTEIGRIAEKHELIFVDLFTPLRSRGDQLRQLKIHGDGADVPLSTNGVHLEMVGHFLVAELIADQLDFPGKDGDPPTLAAIDRLHEAISWKNRLWQQYYRPTNWAFLFGNRQHVPASRDPVARDQRWFVRELDSLPALIEEAEEKVHRHARTAAGAERNRQ